MSFDQQVSDVVRSCNYHIQSLLHIQPLIDCETAVNLTCRLDYCNSVLYGVTDTIIAELQPKCKIILLVLYVNRRTTFMSPNYCVNCTRCLLGRELLTRLQLLHIIRETVGNLVNYVTHLLVINLLEHCASQVQIYSLFRTVLKLLLHLVLFMVLHQLSGIICPTLLKLRIRSMF